MDKKPKINFSEPPAIINWLAVAIAICGAIIWASERIANI